MAFQGLKNRFNHGVGIKGQNPSTHWWHFYALKPTSYTSSTCCVNQEIYLFIVVLQHFSPTKGKKGFSYRGQHPDYTKVDMFCWWWVIPFKSSQIIYSIKVTGPDQWVMGTETKIWGLLILYFYSINPFMSMKNYWVDFCSVLHVNPSDEKFEFFAICHYKHLAAGIKVELNS